MDTTRMLYERRPESMHSLQWCVHSTSDLDIEHLYVSDPCSKTIIDLQILIAYGTPSAGKSISHH